MMNYEIFKEVVKEKFMDYMPDNFKGMELVDRGVEMEAYSIEDNGAGVSFHVFVYNYQPGIEIDYMTGESWIK